MKKMVSLLLAVFLLAAVVSACGGSPSSSSSSGEAESSQPQSGGSDESGSESTAEIGEERKTELAGLARELTEHMAAGEYEAAEEMMDASMLKVVGGKLEQVWEPNIQSGGAFVKTGAFVAAADSGYEIVEMTVEFESMTMIQRTVFDGDSKVAGLFFRAGMIEAEELPEGVIEEDVVIQGKDGFPLNGKISLPANGEIIAAVVLVHGSGPQDMNSAVGPNAPFMDIAHGLAKKGIAVLRYDKRTYSYGAQMSAEKIGINEETVDDAIGAVELLKGYDGVDPEKVFILGHSMAGGLLAYADSRGADSAGYIVLAGTPRKIWEMSAEQNLLYASELENKDEAKQIEDFVKAETEKAAELKTMSEQDAKNSDDTVFGMPVWYLQSFEAADTIALHMADKKPVLVIQGGKDRQVTETDFSLWKEGLAGHGDASFKLYPELNHLMGEYKGEPVPFINLVDVEYMAKTPVSQQLIDDIAAWLIEQAG